MLGGVLFIDLLKESLDAKIVTSTDELLGRVNLAITTALFDLAILPRQKHAQLARATA